MLVFYLLMNLPNKYIILIKSIYIPVLYLSKIGSVPIF
jgi:hypothetical protein